MIKIVPDANIILSSMLGSYGAPRKLINLALMKHIVMFGSSETYNEFKRKIGLPKFKKYLDRQIFTPEKLTLDYRTYINIIEPFDTLHGVNIVKEDPDDDMYFRVAKACGAQIIITGDKNVLKVKKFDDIIVVEPRKFVEKMSLLIRNQVFS
ncbi:putative toxin-antitoxin system toxin component, PIN family [Candidatus Parcubacteria bacterium]|nr:putative toxin-antitoxin system toxin component, PIN family [Candidatus Parcubacteria bacterium]MCG2809704.1 putative toxin-antitoxin system toxin component, PIN family [Candidatus Portnoybacteria bacterium]